MHLPTGWTLAVLFWLWERVGDGAFELSGAPEHAELAYSPGRFTMAWGCCQPRPRPFIGNSASLCGVVGGTPAKHTAVNIPSSTTAAGIKEHIRVVMLSPSCENRSPH